MKREDYEKERKIEKINSKTIEFLIEKSHPIRQVMSLYKCAMLEVETKFKVLDEDFSVLHSRNPINNIKTRLKSPISISNKLDKLNLPYTHETMLNDLHDIAGVRVICSFIDDVYLLADALLRQEDVTLIKRKDYIKNPKKNGYRSLHLIVSIPIFLANETYDVKVEVQLRTSAMDFWASLEHQLRYKKEIDFNEEMANELYECAEISAQLDRRMGDLYQNTMLLLEKNNKLK